MISALFTGFFFFLLSADHLSVAIGSGHFKFAYFLVPAFWAIRPLPMLRTAKSLVCRLRPVHAIPLLMLIPSLAHTVDPSSTTLWFGWFLFDLATTLTVACFLQSRPTSDSWLRIACLFGLAMIAFFGFLQYASIYFYGAPLFDPQVHRSFYRLNGISGWPHFLNIFSFLLLPIAVADPRWLRYERPVLATLVFVLTQSTAKTGWVLACGMGVIFFIEHREVFYRKILGFLMPVTLLALLVPSPRADHLPSNAIEKVSRVAQDLNPTANGSGRDRLLINRMGLLVFLKHPFTGIGPRAYESYVLHHFESEIPGENKYDVNGKINNRNENIWIELLSETGILFTGSVILFLVYWLSRFRAGQHHPALLATWCALALYYGVSGQFSQNFLLTMPFAIWGVLIHLHLNHHRVTD